MSTADILNDLAARGLIHDTTDIDALRDRLGQGPVSVYAGFDPTADSLHVGNLVPLMLLRRFQLFGHRPVALAGGATGMIGDPGGRSSERSLLDAATLDSNLAAIKPQLEMLLDFAPGDTQASLVDNRDWTAPMGVLEFLRDVGKHVTVNTMLAKDSVKSRVESDAGISFTEFSYMLLQANDFHHLFNKMKVELQVGGSDQWGNITAGIDLIRRKEGAHVHGLTVPLVTRADGQKFGKSVDGAVWLSPERTTPYAFFQYFVNVDDRDVERFLLQMTLLPVDEVASVLREHQTDPGKRHAQQVLAKAVTALVHGQAEAEQAAGASQGFTRAAGELSGADWAELASSLPTFEVTPADLGRDLVEFLSENKAIASRSEGRRLIAQSGLTFNDEVVTEGRVLSAGDFNADGYALARRGKKQRFILHFSSNS
ncbi:MAG: tyrosine--tRNA ligase [Actinobacteria bacterium]|uniref:tyrosine--tRNA ligase n=1 Tax=freshwater metagenome TaxID=449393 RepID=A0A6J6XZI8_9ZZZZ|nr:tyrosine--tRNA ligase [Actinomycetota bacterium]